MSSVYIIAELSANHNNDLALTKETIRAMKESGADAVKLQTYTPDSMTFDMDGVDFEANPNGIWAGQRLYDLYKKAALPYEWHDELMNYAKSLGLDCFSSPFDFHAVDFLEDLGVPSYKIASFEIQDIPLIKYTASKGKPIIMSTGIATEEDIALAVAACREVGNNDITLLKCTSAYPTPWNEINLQAIPLLKQRFGVKVGLSDHTMGHVVALGAVALGAQVVEKHFTLSRANGGVDSSFSMEPAEFADMVTQIRQLEQALGSATFELTEKQLGSRTRGRSLFVSADVKAGEQITKDNIKSIRPGNGLHPKYYDQLLKSIFVQDIDKGTPLTLDMVQLADS